MKHQITRRTFLGGAAAIGLTSSLDAFAQPVALAPQAKGAAPALVVIYLRGGADNLNMVIPYKDEDYRLARPTLALGEDDGVLKIENRWALNPAMSGLAELYRQKRLAVVLNTGSPHPTRSHFDAQDFMEFAAPGDRTVRSGWINRYLTATSKPGESRFRALAMQSLLPRSFRGDFPVLAVPNSYAKKASAEVLDDFEELYGAEDNAPGKMDEGSADRTDVVQSGRITIETLRKLKVILDGQASGDGGYPRTGFARGLRSIATVLEADEGLEVAGLDYNGWDHHARQGATSGRHAQMVGDLSASLTAFCKQLGERLDRTLIVIMTEFGRTVRENGNDGTDHGHGGAMFLLGGDVKGGRIHGKWKGLSEANLYQGRDLPVETDFRDVMAEVLREHMNFKPPKDYFPDYRPGKIKLF